MRHILACILMVATLVVLAVPPAAYADTAQTDPQTFIQSLLKQISALQQQLGALKSQVPDNPTNVENQGGSSAPSSVSAGPTANVRGVLISQIVSRGVPCKRDIGPQQSFRPGDSFCIWFHTVNTDRNIPLPMNGDASSNYDVISVDVADSGHLNFSEHNKHWDSGWNQNDDVYVQGVISADAPGGTYAITNHVAVKNCRANSKLGIRVVDCGGWTDGYVSTNITIEGSQAGQSSIVSSVLVGIESLLHSFSLR